MREPSTGDFCLQANELCVADDIYALFMLV